MGLIKMSMGLFFINQNGDMVILPKLYRVVKIKFWSLRMGLGSNYGVIFDVDTEVVRKARRVRIKEGWKWQLVDCDDFYLNENEEDELCLNEYNEFELV